MSAASTIWHSFSHAAPHYDTHSSVQHKAAAQNAALIRHYCQPTHIMLDVGCGTGLIGRALPDYRNIIHLDAAHGMCERSADHARHVLCADGNALPLRSQGIDRYIACFSWQWMHPLSSTIREMQRVVRCGGIAIITVPLVTSLPELRHSLRAINANVILPPLPSMAMIQGAFHDAGLTQTTHILHHYTTQHNTALEAMKSLHHIGATQRQTTPLSATQMRALLRYYTQHYRTDDGTLPCSYDVTTWIVQL